METLVYQYWFLANKIIPTTKKAKLIDFFMDAYHIYFANRDELLATGLIDEKTVDLFLDAKMGFDLQKEYESFCRSPFSFVTIESESYPHELRYIFDPPYGLFYIGMLPDFSKSVSIVGARRCSEYGKKMAYDLGRILSENGYVVVSGMASGVDAFAHKGCLMGPTPTVAVLGCGADIVYPKENRLLYEQILSNGCVVSEYAMSTQPQQMFFPQRNRIVSGLSKAVIVVEARLKSGSLITADCALEQGKDIYVVPGRVGDTLSEGCNRLITQGANAIVSIEQFVKELTDSDETVITLKKERNGRVKLSEEQLLVLSYFDNYPKSLAEVEGALQMDYLKLVTIVMSLVGKGILTEVFKNHFVICM